MEVGFHPSLNSILLDSTRCFLSKSSIFIGNAIVLHFFLLAHANFMMQSYRYSTKVSAKTYVEINQKAPKWQIGTLVNIFIRKLRDHQTYHINSMVLRVRKDWRRRTIRRRGLDNTTTKAKEHIVSCQASQCVSPHNMACSSEN